MPLFTFEIVRRGNASVVAQILMLSEQQSVWCYVEALALRIQGGDKMSIRVKNAGAETVVQTGVATALASIKKCKRPDCPIQRDLE
ncbi:MAG: hypothetical protein P4L76_14905 [Beijerinckiaceae bacterium]|nr:hypothetical protein [Beijerinckiaceae bacterium]